MRDLCYLIAQRLLILLIAVSERINGDTRAEIKILLSVRIIEPYTVRMIEYYRVTLC